MTWAQDVADLNRSALDLEMGFGVAYSWAPGGVVDPTPRPGIFKQAHERVDLQLEAGVSSYKPTLWVDPADIATPIDSADRVIVNGTTYEITDSPRNEEGMLLLELTEAA